MDPETQNYIDSKTEATRAQNDARFAEILARLEQAPTIHELRKLVITTGIAIVATVIAALAFGADRFGVGMEAASLVYEQSEEARRMAEENAENIREMREDLDIMREDLDTLIRILSERAEAGAL